METILIIEKESTLRKLYKEELEEEGYQVLHAENSKEALDIIKERALDLIVADDQMFPLRSYVTMLQKSYRMSNIPVLVQTVYTPDPGEYAPYGMLECLIKTSNVITLKNKLRKMLDDRNHN